MRDSEVGRPKKGKAGYHSSLEDSARNPDLQLHIQYNIVCVCVCVCVWKREKKKTTRVSLCVFDRALCVFEMEGLNVCIWENKRRCVCALETERERERESDRERVRKSNCVCWAGSLKAIVIVCVFACVCYGHSAEDELSGLGKHET